MPNGKTIRNSGQAGLIRKDTLDDLRELHDAVHGMECKPEGTAELIINGKKAILNFKGLQKLNGVILVVINAETETVDMHPGSTLLGSLGPIAT